MILAISVVKDVPQSILHLLYGPAWKFELFIQCSLYGYIYYIAYYNYMDTYIYIYITYMDTVVQVDPEASLNVKNALCWLQCFIEGRSPFSLAIKKSQFPALKMSKSQFPFYPFRTPLIN